MTFCLSTAHHGIGTTSISVHVEAEVERKGETIAVTQPT